MELPSETTAKFRERKSESALRTRNLKWFTEFYFDREVLKIDYLELNKRGFEFVVGKIYTFFYFDPKYKEELEFYNAVPVGIYLGKTKTGNPMFLGLQFIPPKIREKVLDILAKMNEGLIDQANKTILRSGYSNRKLKTTYGDLKAFLKKSGFEFAIRSYIITRIKSEPLIITYYDWWRLSTFSGQFMKKKHIAYIYYKYKENIGINQFEKKK